MLIRSIVFAESECMGCSSETQIRSELFRGHYFLVEGVPMYILCQNEIDLYLAWTVNWLVFIFVTSPETSNSDGKKKLFSECIMRRIIK